MFWDEDKHPRDEKGQFTFKNGESSSSTKEQPADILYRDSKIKAEKDRQEAEYKSKLLDILGNKVKPTDVLYRTTKELEEKVKEYGLQDKLKGVITGEASGIENQETKQKVKLLPKIELGNSQTPLKGMVSYDEIKNINLNNGNFSSDSIKKAREFIQGNEGFSDKAYQDKAGVWTIGYGHTGYVDGKPISQGMKITKDKAEELYKKDFESHIAPLKDIKTPLTKNQQIALSSFIYNFGVGAFNKSELRKKIEGGDIKGAANEFDKWVYVKNKNTGKKEVSQGLVNRRKREKDLFSKPDD